MTTIKSFKTLHQSNTPLLIGNVWDVPSAKTFESLGYQAIGTSSAAVAHMLGYEDGEQMPFETYFGIIERIAACSSIPLSVDLESGYGSTTEQVVKNIERLLTIGVVGINIEDTNVVDGNRIHISTEALVEQMQKLSTLLNNKTAPFINLRLDTFLLKLPNAIEETIERIDQCSEFVDGIFLPFIEREEDIKAIAQRTSLPVNVMCMPKLPDFETLTRLGVKRISMGNFLHKDSADAMKSIATEIKNTGSFKPVFED